MLKASSSGILFLRRLLAAHAFAHTNRHLFATAHQCPFHIQIRPSSFSNRFSARFAMVTGTDSGTGSQKSIEAGMQLEAKPELITTRQMRSSYLPWNHTTSQKGVRVSKKAGGVGKKPKHAKGVTKSCGGRKVAAPKQKRHVNRAKPGHSQDRKIAKANKARSVHREVVKLPADLEGRTQGETLKTETSPGVSHEEVAEEILQAYSSGELQIEDLSVSELRAIIFDKRSDLMGLVWDAYQRLVYLDAEESGFRSTADEHAENGLFGTKLLTRLANRLVAERKLYQKNSREIFLRLLSVYARLRRERGHTDGVPYLRTAEWNCLIHFAGTGLRGRTSLEAYNAALDIYDDMLRGVEDARAAGSDTLLSDIEPDIYTYTSLLNIALRSHHQPAIEHAMKLLQDSGKEPTRITHLCMIRYRYRLDGLVGVRDVLSSLRPEDVGIDGVVAYMACAGNEGNLSIVQNIYNALRQNMKPLDDDGIVNEGRSSDTLGREEPGEFVVVEGIRLPRSLVPSAAVYNYVVQIFAYHGYLPEALQAFTDMISTPRPGSSGEPFQPNFAVFRGLFLGFARHGCRQDTNSSTRTTLSLNQHWTWERFCVILDAFFEMGDSIMPNERMVFWIMAAVRRMTRDERLLKEVWHRLNTRWPIRKGGRLQTLDMKYGEREGAHTI